MSKLYCRVGIALLSVVALGFLAPGTTAAQEPDRKDCVVRAEPGGMIRGDQIPSGCLLRNETDEPPEYPETRWITVLGACEAFTERIDFTPAPKHSTLVAMLKRCRALLRAADPAARPGSADFESFNDEFGSLLRHFGSMQRHFGSMQRHFGSIDRHFGSTRRHFGSIERHFGRSPAARDERGGG